MSPRSKKLLKPSTTSSQQFEQADNTLQSVMQRHSRDKQLTETTRGKTSHEVLIPPYVGQFKGAKAPFLAAPAVSTDSDDLNNAINNTKPSIRDPQS